MSMEPRNKVIQRIKVSGGGCCKACGSRMQRYRHPNGWAPKIRQRYWYEWWDICQCRYTQLYEEARRLVPGQPAKGAKTPSCTTVKKMKTDRTAPITAVGSKFRPQIAEEAAQCPFDCADDDLKPQLPPSEFRSVEQPRKETQTRLNTDITGMKVTKLPPGEAIGARDLHNWSSRRNANRTGVFNRKEAKKLKKWDEALQKAKAAGKSFNEMGTAMDKAQVTEVDGRWHVMVPAGHGGTLNSCYSYATQSEAWDHVERKDIRPLWMTSRRSNRR